jgi:hypothetical protein
MVRAVTIVVPTLLLAVALVSCSNKSARTVQAPISWQSAIRSLTDQRSAPRVMATPPGEIDACVTSDSGALSCSANFTFTIGPNLPRFTFKINGFPTAIVSDIQVFRGESTEPSQRLTGCDLSEMEAPPSVVTDPPWFRTEDINFDGFQDIYLMTSWGATGNQGGCVWVFDPTFDAGTGRFEYSKEFSGLARHWLDPHTKTIFSFGRGGMAGTIYGADKFDVEDNRPVLIYSEDQDYDDSKMQYHCVVRER